jgi:hypothetical protein
VTFSEVFNAPLPSYTRYITNLFHQYQGEAEGLQIKVDVKCHRECGIKASEKFS